MSEPIVFRDENGQRGTIIAAPQGQGEPEAEILLENGETLRVPISRFVRNSDGTYSLLPQDVVVPVLAEQLHIQKRSTVTGTVRIHKTVHEHEEVADVPLRSETFQVERVPVNRPIEAPAVVRQEGETTIYPVMEEVLVVTKQLILKEELRVTRHTTEVHHPERVQLRSEQVTIERLPADAPAEPVPRQTND